MSTNSPHHPTDLLQRALRRESPILRLDASAAIDADRLDLAPASLLIDAQSAEILAADHPTRINAHPLAAVAWRIDLPDHTLIPGLANAHAHLDLTHIGPLPHDPADGFVSWIARIRSARAIMDDQIASSVSRGVELLLAGAVVAVGDIAGAPNATPTLVPWRALSSSPLRGVSFIETFGIGTRQAAAIDRLDRLAAAHEADFLSRGDVRLGISPHAPYTVSPETYTHVLRLAANLNLPICTHLAESPEERAFTSAAQGPFRDFLTDIGLWHDDLLTHYARSARPEDLLLHAFLQSGLAGRSHPLATVHVNDCTDETLRALDAMSATVLYCPRASAYFGAEAHFGPHRYRDMLAAGIPVALGTDSIVNLPPSSADPRRGEFSTLPEMRLLYRRDSFTPRTLLAMATTMAAPILGLDPDLFRLAPGCKLLGVAAIPNASSLAAALTNDNPPQLLWIRK